MKNYGISVTGGKVEAGAMAAGDNATATNISAASDSLTDARAEMADLLELLRAVPELPEQTVAMAELADRELGKEEPDKSSVLRLLELIASGATSIASIGGAVTAVQHAVSAIL
ncbi:hypothetical protein EV138_2206 [Kribbella voronezhensis]|uniref:Uncharacterized protein n=1 Tax=Kribbella voronezhensis TaxID=2512212 RepID=A0A4R7T9J6_9ACTN|nr:hypothetical protein [Kribbella voronezhensis]TDU88660.1 hypothetical protein EV138_2206 [Kribbella voronezhensis]